MLVNEKDITSLLGTDPLTEVETNALTWFRKANGPDIIIDAGVGDRVAFVGNLFARELYEQNQDNSKYWGPKPIALPELLYGNLDGKTRVRGYCLVPPNVPRRVVLVAMAEYFFADAKEYLDLSLPENERRKVSRIEGELKRFGAREWHRKASEVPISPALIDFYCSRFSLEPMKPLMHKYFNINN